ncbi:hypothetical protein H8356DRAFT_1330284 [Neocallimastix lanati (nom. inval.)]|nr:hypothetical protein H8356DRAFT_1330284 [Neocallimastix sp. JGI-2020a]
MKGINAICIEYLLVIKVNDENVLKLNLLLEKFTKLAKLGIINFLTKYYYQVELARVRNRKSIPRKIVLENLGNNMFGCPVETIFIKCCDCLNIHMS